MPVTTFIKLDRSIQNWRWYKNANVARLFIHLLINANHCDNDFEDITVHRGELATSYASLAQALDMSVQSIRTAMKKLRDSGELTVNRHRNYSIIFICGYDKYQSAPHTADSHATGNQQTSNRPLTDRQQATNNNIRSKEVKNERMEEVCVEEQTQCADCTVFPDSALSSEIAHAHGIKCNVYLTDRQYKEATKLYGERTPRLIDELSLKISMSPERYPTEHHYDCLQLFALHDKETRANAYRQNKAYESFNSRASYDIEKAMEKARTVPKTIKKRNRQSISSADALAFTSQEE